MKRYASIPRLLLLFAAYILLAVSVVCGQAVRWSPHADWEGRQVHLGPTGARGWVQDHRIHVVRIAHGAPADGVLKPHDTLTGANGRRFAEGSDPRKLLGQAITESETPRSRGRLNLLVERDGTEMQVAVQLRVMGQYAATWPAKCQKSAKILREACGFLASKQYPDGHIPSEVGMFTAYSGLLFLASDDPALLDNARRAAHWLSRQDYRAMELNAWPSGYAAMMMAEYYLKTGDPTVLPKLRDLADFITEGQMACGSWAHNMPWGGYGAVNQVGLVCLIALKLTQECGVEVDQAALDRGYAFFAKYADKGWIPYGDHRPWLGTSGNGKNSLGVVAFDLLGSAPEKVRLFSGTVADAYDHRETGHTGCYFSLMWGPIAARHAGDDAFRRFLDAQRWYYDLARTHDGGLVCQPNPENLGGRTPGSYTFDGPEGTTAGVGLFYALPLRSLRVLGAEPSVFGGKLTGKLAEMRNLYEQRKWDALGEGLAKLADDDSLSAEQTRYVGQLAAAAKMQRQSVATTLESIERHAEDGDPYRAWELYASLECLLGNVSPQLAEAKPLMEFHAPGIETGREYYAAWEKLMFYRTLYWTDYGRHAKRQLQDLGPVGPKPWKVLLATSQATPQTWRVWPPASDKADSDTPQAAGPAGWQQKCLQADFDDSAWPEQTGPVEYRPPRNGPDGPSHLYLRRTFTVDDKEYTAVRLRFLGARGQKAEIHLNGVLLAELLESPRSGYTAVALQPAAVALLRRGENVLAVHCSHPEGRPLTFDVGVEATAY